MVFDASGTFSETKRLAGLLRMLQAGVIVSDYGTLMVEILKDNSQPEAGAVYGAIDMPWAKLVGQIAPTYGKYVDCSLGYMLSMTTLTTRPLQPQLSEPLRPSC
jgi:hypothetical protein